MPPETRSSRILMLHRVLEDRPAAFGLPACTRMRGTALTPSELDELLDTVGPVLPLSVVEDALGHGRPPPSGTVLTFDDGYREHIDLVAPTLAARGCTATFYVATGLRGDGQAVAVVDAWYWLLDHARAPVAEVPLRDGQAFRRRLDTLEAKREWVSGTPKAGLLAASPEHQRDMIAALSDAVRAELPGDLAARLYMSPADWEALASLGMRLGAHSVTHPRLTQVGSPERRGEIDASVRTVSSLASPVAFAYPDGCYDDAVLEAVSRAGVSSAVTCEAGILGVHSELLRLPRLFVRPDNLGSLA